MWVNICFVVVDVITASSRKEETSEDRNGVVAFLGKVQYCWLRAILESVSAKNLECTVSCLLTYPY
jgi:hypothetical protein